MTATLGVILAGGLARRMGGGDKGLAPLNGQPILQHVLQRLAPQVHAVVLNANGDPARFQSLPIPVIPDTIPDHPGPLAGVLAGMAYAQTPWIVTVPCDAPLIPHDLVHSLHAAQAEKHADIVTVQSRGRTHPVIALWATHLKHDLHHAITTGTRKVEHWTDNHSRAVVTYDHDPFFNINTPEDLHQTAERLKHH